MLPQNVLQNGEKKNPANGFNVFKQLCPASPPPRMLIGSVTPLKSPETVPVGASQDGLAQIQTGNLGSTAPRHP